MIPLLFFSFYGCSLEAGFEHGGLFVWLRGVSVVYVWKKAMHRRCRSSNPVRSALAWYCRCSYKEKETRSLIS